jgi:hypothetical protein
MKDLLKAMSLPRLPVHLGIFPGRTGMARKDELKIVILNEVKNLGGEEKVLVGYATLDPPYRTIVLLYRRTQHYSVN